MKAILVISLLPSYRVRTIPPNTATPLVLLCFFFRSIHKETGVATEVASAVQIMILLFKCRIGYWLAGCDPEKC